LLYIVRFMSSWVEFTTSILLIFAMLRILDRSVLFRIVLVSFIMTIVSFTLKVIIPVGYISLPAVVLTSILLLMIIFQFSAWLSILLGIVSAFISMFFEMLVALPFLVLGVIDPLVRDLLIDSLMLVPVSLFNLALVWLLTNRKWGLSLPDSYMYGNRYLFRKKYIICAIIFLFSGISLSAYTFAAQYGLGYTLIVLALYFSIVLVLKLMYQSNKKILMERYGKLGRTRRNEL
jgi:hypothetical protein